MPTVPRVDAFQVAQTALPQTRISAPEVPDVGGQQTQRLAQASQQLGDAAGRVAADIAQQANQIRVDDALNRTKETALRLTYDKDAGYTNIKGLTALERPDGKALSDEYAENLQKQIDEVSSTLGNDVQRAAFISQAGGMLNTFRGQIMQHEAQEFKTYELSTSEGIQNTALREIGLSWNNPEAINMAMERIKAETYRQAQLLGKSAEWQEATSRKMISNAHKVALMSALESNEPGYADSYLKRYSESMDADDILSVRGTITKEVDAKVALSAASDALQTFQPRIATSNTERAFNVALGTESGNKQFDKDGNPLTSIKGAIGIAQVMPTTGPEAAKLAGLDWDEVKFKNDANYNRALGLAYFQKQLQDNGGDLAKAYAAYNAGPGALQAAIKKADRDNKLAANDASIPVRGWLEYLPEETRNYVAKNMREYESGEGVPTRPTFQEIDQKLRENPLISGNPARYKIAREEAMRQYTDQTNAIKAREDESVANAMRGLVSNGGRYSELPISIRSAVPPKEVDNLISFGQKIAKGDDTTSLWLYSKLSNNPDYLRSLSDNDFYRLRRELSEADFKHFTHERAKLTGAAPGANSPADLNTQAIKQTLDERLRVLGVDPTPKDDGGSDAQRVGGIRKFVNDYFISAQSEAGKKFNDAEVAAHLDKLFARNTTLRGFFTDKSGPMLTMKIGDLPSDVKNEIRAAYKRQGVDNPTDTQILDIYWKQQITQK